jgi:recA bacterial DNA recombination protein
MADAARDRYAIANEALQALRSTSKDGSLASALVMGAAGPQNRDCLPMRAPLGAVLPEGGFPRGGVVEIASPANLGHGLGVALAACAATQEESVNAGREKAWCAFLDPDHTLFGPALQQRGVALDRLLVLRPPRPLLARAAVQVAAARIFSVIVVDVSSVPGASTRDQHRFEAMETWSKVTRRLALSLEKTPTTLFLLTRTEAHRPLSLPVAMRLELDTVDPDNLVVRIAKEKFGRVTSPKQIAWTRPSDVDAPRGEGGNRFSSRAGARSAVGRER